MPTTPIVRTQLNLGVNLRGLTGGVNMIPGQAQDSVDMLPREDGAVFSHWGWLRANATALAGRLVGIKCFSYKGKNVGAFTRRGAIYTGAIALTDTTFYFWRSDTGVFEIEALPAPAAVDLNPKPSFVVVNDSVYIFGYADYNLRYDPTDQAIYLLGWDDLPTVIAGGSVAQAAGGTLIVGAVYQYATAWFNVYTGEVGPMGTIHQETIAVGNGTVNFAIGAFADYAGTRHFVGAGANDDVGLVIYRTEPDGGAFFFLGIIYPELLLAGAFADTGLATAKGEKALRGAIADEPRFNAADLFNDIIYAISWDTDYNRVYWNDWKGANSYHDRWPILNVSALPTQQGESLTAITHTERNLLALSQQRGFIGTVSMSASGRVSTRWSPLPWTVGAVGPKAVCTAGPWIYFLSERGPYRWREGLAEPQWIGRDLLALFIDPTSGLCKLNPESKNQSEVAYDLDANVVRFIFPCGGATTPNIHLMYWVHDDIPELDYAAGWFFCSTRAQTLAYGNAITGLNADGFPVSPFERKARMIWGDTLGYVNEYEVGHNRGGLPAVIVATGEVQTTSTVNLVVTIGGLYNIGDGMIGMRLEIVHLDGTIDVRVIAANDATDITPDLAFSQNPVGATWYAAGVPSFWRSVPEHFGDPYPHKAIVDVGVKMVAMRPALGLESLDLSIQSGDYPVEYRKTEEIDLALYHDKTMASVTGRFVQLEFANTRPDGFFCVTSYAMWVKGEATREADG